jgi:hypothetical protein
MNFSHGDSGDNNSQRQKRVKDFIHGDTGDKPKPSAETWRFQISKGLFQRMWLRISPDIPL